MIKVKTTDNKIILGIDKENVNRLQKGKPIRVHGNELGIKQTIFIVYGDTLDDIVEELGLPRQH